MDTTTASNEQATPPEAAKQAPESKMDAGPSENNMQTLPERSKPAKVKKEKVAKAPKGPTPPKQKREPAAATIPNEPDSMFKVGFLADVYQERPIGSGGVSKVVTRCESWCCTVYKRRPSVLTNTPIVPPEPNGFLHIGHSKAIAINFGFARYHGGECYLRFDDTNPAGEKKEYDDSIEETVRWLGFTPKKITHSSDNFDRLYELAEVLIQKDGAYVCHCTSGSFQTPQRRPLD